MPGDFGEFVELSGERLKFDIVSWLEAIRDASGGPMREMMQGVFLGFRQKITAFNKRCLPDKDTDEIAVVPRSAMSFFDANGEPVTVRLMENKRTHRLEFFCDRTDLTGEDTGEKEDNFDRVSRLVMDDLEQIEGYGEFTFDEFVGSINFVFGQIKELDFERSFGIRHDAASQEAFRLLKEFHVRVDGRVVTVELHATEDGSGLILNLYLEDDDDEFLMRLVGATQGGDLRPKTIT